MIFEVIEIPEQKRLTAVKCSISDVSKGKFVKQEGFEPNYTLTALGQKLSRVRIMATIVSKYVSENKQFAAVTLDDATDTIRAKAFKGVSILDAVEVGDIVDVFGKIREWNNEVYIIPEIIVKIDDPNWITLRKLELKKLRDEAQKFRDTVHEYQAQTSDLEELKRIMQDKHGISGEQVEAILISDEAEDEAVSNRKENKERVLQLIGELDKGKGADYADVAQKSGLPESEIDSIINDLLTEGTCFEPRPGKIKKL